MKYLVTGGAGFIGSHIVEALLQAGNEVRVFDNLSTGNIKNLVHIWDQIEFVKGDVRDPLQCEDAVKGCVGIFHQAALVSVTDSIARPMDNHDINITGTINLLEAARKHNARRIVFASSAAIYGDNPELPKRENMAPEPKSPYGTVKIGSEYYLRNYADQFGISCVALRYFNVYGKRQDPSSMYSGVISKFTDCARKCQSPTIFGDGEQTRDFVHVDDVVQANINAMTRPLSSSFVHCNVATGKGTRLLDIINVLSEITGMHLEPDFAPERYGDIRHSVADISQAQEILGYQPKSTNLKKNLVTMLDYESSLLQSGA